MQTREAISSPTFTGLWEDVGLWHVKFSGRYIGGFKDLRVASANLERGVHKAQQKHTRARLIHAVTIASLRIEVD